MPHHSHDHGGTHWGLRIVMILALVVCPGLLGWVLVNTTRQREVLAVRFPRRRPTSSGRTRFESSTSVSRGQDRG